jgi:flagellum-specific peptidoglycan hydrolase FlgJ
MFWKNQKKKFKANTSKSSDDDFDFDFDDDFDFNFDSSINKDDRKPVLKNISSVFSGTKRSLFKKPDNFRDLNRDLSKILPDTYGETLTIADDVYNTYAEALNNATTQLRPLNSKLKVISNKLAQQGEKIIPNNKILEKLKKYGESDDDSNSGQYGSDVKAAALNATLSNIFTIKEEADQQRYKLDQKQDAQKEVLRLNQHQQTLSQLDAIRQATQSVQQYQDNVLINYQRKSLELQIKHYGIDVETLQFMKSQHIDLKNELTAIRKNTGIPDFAKMRHSDTFRELLRNKFTDQLHTSLFNTGKNLFPNLTKNISKNLTDNITNFAQNLSMGLMGLETALDTVGMMDEKIDPYAIAGEFIGSGVRNKLSGVVKKKLSKNKKFNRHASGANIWLNNTEANLRRIIKNELNAGYDSIYNSGFDDLDDEFNTSESSKKKSKFNTFKKYLNKVNPVKKGGRARNYLFSYLEERLNETTNGLGTTFQKDSFNDLNKPAIINGRFVKSVTQVMPGYLARILKELSIIRTGNENTELVEYDFVKDRFSTKSGIKRTIFSEVTKKGDILARYNSALDGSVLNRDIDKHNIITPEVKKKLGIILLNANRSGNVVIDKKWLTDPKSFSALGSSVMAEKIARMFSSYLADDEDREKEKNLVNSIKSSTGVFSNPLSFIQDVMNVGQSDILTEMGLVNDKDGSFSLNKEKYIDFIFNSNKIIKETESKNSVNKSFSKFNNFNRDGYKSDEFNQPNNYNRVSITEQIDKLIESNQNLNNSLIESVLASSSRDINSDILNSVLSIYERLGTTQAINLSQMTGEPVDYDEIPSAKDLPWFRKGRSFSNQMKVFRKKISDIALRASGKALKWSIMGPAKLGWLSLKTSFKLPFNLMKGVKETKKRADDLIGDIYVKGEMSPRITKIQLIRGSYIDRNTGRRVKKFKDITGDVVDNENNIILAADEIPNAYVSIGAIKKTVSLASYVTVKAFDLGLNVLSGATNIYTASLKAGWNVLKFGFKKTKDFLNAPVAQDVYVAGVRGPVITAKLTKLGHYIDVNTGKYIKEPNDITGMVVDIDGDVVITEEQFSHGLKNKYGQSIGGGFRVGYNFVTRNLGRALKVGVGALKLTNKLVGGAVKGAYKTLKWTGGALKSLATGKGITLLSFGNTEEAQVYTASASGSIVERLDKIYDLLDDRLADQTVDGDYDNSGYRDGSVAEQMAKRRAAKEAKEKEADGENDGFVKKMFKKPGRDTPIEQLVKLFKRYSKRQEEQMKELIEETDENGDIAAASSMFDFFSRDKGGKGKGKGGRIKRLGKGIGRGVKSLFSSKLGKIGMAGALGYSAIKSAGDGNYTTAGLEGAGAAASAGSLFSNASKSGLGKVVGRFAVPVTVALGGYSAAKSFKSGDNKGGTEAIGATGGALGGMWAGGALGAAIGSAIPIVGTAVGGFIGGVIGGIAGSSAGKWIGNKVYKGWRWLTGANKDKWHKLRLAQYGFSDESRASAIFALEQMCEEAMVLSGGIPEIAGNKLDQAKILTLFDVSTNDAEAVDKFRTWFINRFKPVWQANVALLNKLQPNAKLDNLDNLPKDIQTKFIDAIAKLSSDVYSFMGSPFKNERLLEVDKEHVKAIVTSLQNKLGTNDKTKEEKNAANKALAIAAANSGISKSTVDGVSRLNDPKVNTKTSFKDKLLSIGKKALFTSLGLTGSILEYVIPTADARMMSISNLDALTMIRFKAYGLNGLEPDKVRDLIALENKAMQFVSISASKVSISGDLIKLANDIKSTFGGEDNDVFNWIKNRFFPVFAAFISACKSQGIENNFLSKSSLLVASKQIAIADVIKAANSPDGIAIWNILTSPWKGYHLSNSASIINNNYLALTTKAKSETMSEQKVSAAKVKAAEKTGIFGNVLTSLKAFASRFNNGITDIKNSISSTVSDAVTEVEADYGDMKGALGAAWGSITGSNKEKFMKVMEAARKAGDPHPAIVAAQWAGESAWGNRTSGKFNYFGVKAGPNEPGTMAATHEVINGRRVAVKAKFKDYNSLEEAIKGRVDFIATNPRYRKAGYFNARTPLEAVMALKAGKYATDPNYDKLLIKIMRGVGIDPTKPESNNFQSSGGFPTWGKGTGVNTVSENHTVNPSVTPAKQSIQPRIVPNSPKARSVPTSGYESYNYLDSIGGGFNTSVTNVAKNTVLDDTVKSNISTSAKPHKAAMNATQAAGDKSKGLCAKYVANALQGAGYKFNRNPSAYQYATNGTLAQAGFIKIANNMSPQTGDVRVFGQTNKHIHGHIQLFNGKQWVSDFRQNSAQPYREAIPFTTWRDRNFLNGGIPDLSSVSYNGDNVTGSYNPYDSGVATPPYVNRGIYSRNQSGYNRGNSTSNYPNESRGSDSTNVIDSTFDSIAGIFPNAGNGLGKVKSAISAGKNIYDLIKQIKNNEGNTAKDISKIMNDKVIGYTKDIDLKKIRNSEEYQKSITDNVDNLWLADNFKNNKHQQSIREANINHEAQINNRSDNLAAKANDILAQQLKIQNKISDNISVIVKQLDSFLNLKKKESNSSNNSNVNDRGSDDVSSNSRNDKVVAKTLSTPLLNMNGA